jgi:hypothetical protein
MNRQLTGLFLLFSFSLIHSAEYPQLEDLVQDPAGQHEDDTEAKNAALLLPRLQQIAKQNNLALLSQDDPHYTNNEVIRLIKAERVACKQSKRPFDHSKALHVVVAAKVYSPTACCCWSGRYCCLCRLASAFCIKWFDCCCCAPSQEQVASMKDILHPENMEEDRLLLRHHNSYQREYGLTIAYEMKNALARQQSIRSMRSSKYQDSNLPYRCIANQGVVAALSSSLSIAVAPVPVPPFRASLSHTPTSIFIE